MKIAISISIVVSFLLTPPALAQSSDNESIKKISATILADQRKLAADQAAIDTILQAFKTALAQLRADEAAGNASAVATGQTKLEDYRALLHGARQTMQTDQQQLRKDAAIVLSADQAAIENALAKLMQDKAAGNTDALATDEAALENAKEQARVNHQAIWGAEQPTDEATKESSPQPAPKDAPAIQIIKTESKPSQTTWNTHARPTTTNPSNTTTSKNSSAKKLTGKSKSTLGHLSH